MQNIVSFSGGKDSTAMLLMMLEKGIQVDKIIFADTTLEFPEMYDWIDKIENLIQRPIEKIKPKKTWDEHFYGVFTRGKFKGRRRGFPFLIQKCWWNREAKYLLLDKAHGVNNTIFIGIAIDEKKRTKAKQYNKTYLTYKFPLCEWNMTEQNCFAYLEKRQLYHPLKKFKRTGCWLCPKQNEKSLEILMKDYPDLWEKLKKYEKDSPQGFKPDFSLNEFEQKIKRKKENEKLIPKLNFN